MHRRYRYIASALLAFFAVVSVAHAQLANMQDPLQVIIAPETPGPYAQVQLEVRGVGSFLGNSIITWTKDGQVVSRGLGKTSYSFTTGPVGSANQIVLDVNSPQGEYQRTYTFAPSEVDMVWEANTSVPLLYGGKSLYSAGSSIKVAAFPAVVSGKSLVATNKLSFQWSVNDTPVTAQSGLGHNVLLIQGDMLHSGETAAVDIYLNNTKVAHGQVTIPASNPMLLMYTKDPLRGEVLDQALPSTFSLGSNEITIQAEPYYFANESKRSGALNYQWTLNGQDTTGPNSGNGILTLRQNGQGKGFASLEVTVQNTSGSSLLQSAESQLNILFGTIVNSSSAPLFGI